MSSQGERLSLRLSFRHGVRLTLVASMALAACAVDNRDLATLPGGRPPNAAADPAGSGNGGVPAVSSGGNGPVVVSDGPDAAVVSGGSEAAAPSSMEVRELLPAPVLVVADAGMGSTPLEPVPAPPVLSVDPTTLAIGSAVVGQSVLGNISVSNAGEGELTARATIAGANSSDFSVTVACAALLQGQSCALGVEFRPSAPGSRTAQLTVFGSDGRVIVVQLSGLGVAPGALTSGASGFDFGGQEVGARSAPFNWVVTNVGGSTTPALGLDSSDPGEFVATNGCTAELAAGSSCTVSVAFVPREGGPRQATLRLGNDTTSLSLQLLGAGQYRLTIVNAGSGSAGGRVSEATAGLECGPTCSALYSPTTVLLKARTLNGSGSYFSSWSDAGCSGIARDCSVQLDGPRTVTANFSRMVNNLIFTTSESYPATLGGVSRYDAECNRLATAAGINETNGRGYIAVMSEAGRSLSSRVGTTARGWVRLDGRAFADRQIDIFGEPKRVLNGVQYDERGLRAASETTWSGTFSDGSADTINCASWTAALGDFVGLGSPFNGPKWLSNFAAECSSGPFAVMCMGTTRSAALAPPQTSTGKRIWLTNTLYVPGAQTPNAKCQAERPVGVSQGVALIAYPDRPATNVLDLRATYVRPDGQLVGTGQQIADLDMIAGPWQHADGSMTLPLGQGYVWTGSQRPTNRADADGSCSNWQDASALGSGGLFGFSNYRAWSYVAGSDCASGASLYCVEP